MTLTIERRSAAIPVELREDADAASPVAVGYAAVFGRRSLDLGGFTEIIDPSAFTKTVSEADVLALAFHDDRALLGRVTSGTLRLNVDDRGLAYEIDLPDTTYGRDVTELLRRGDLKGSSFGMRVIRDEWHQDDEGAVTRTLLEVALHHIAPVPDPAYPDTEAALRSFANAYHLDLAEVASAADERSLGTLIAPATGDEIESDNTDEDGRDEPTALTIGAAFEF